MNLVHWKPIQNNIINVNITSMGSARKYNFSTDFWANFRVRVTIKGINGHYRCKTESYS